MRQLPDKPSELIRLALDDLEVVEKDPRYRIRMAYWHSPNVTAKNVFCDVCFAGAVMANQQGLDQYLVRYDPWSFDRPDKEKYQALDFFRQGLITQGLIHLKRVRPDLDTSVVDRRRKRHIPGFMEIPHYRTSPVQFKARMREMAMRLKSVAL